MSTFQEHAKYIHTDVVKTFRVGILQFSERVHYMHDLAKYLPPSSMKWQEYNEADWAVRYKEFYEYDIHVATRDRLPKFMQD